MKENTKCNHDIGMEYDAAADPKHSRSHFLKWAMQQIRIRKMLESSETKKARIRKLIKRNPMNEE